MQEEGRENDPRWLCRLKNKSEILGAGGVDLLVRVVSPRRCGWSPRGSDDMLDKEKKRKMRPAVGGCV